MIFNNSCLGVIIELKVKTTDNFNGGILICSFVLSIWPFTKSVNCELPTKIGLRVVLEVIVDICICILVRGLLSSNIWEERSDKRRYLYWKTNLALVEWTNYDLRRHYEIEASFNKV